ncbi:TlpA family protein disulfide reductase [Lysobacter silvisoli]|uniref:TlpA family protein disulfide reductase n=1 Tax=Lysobacter silvisoli TaxID=2293254 RepID=A0A371K708_9GAMM|nr:TlpA family protein disulfide reductase [Lysobacter silvisoli]
MALALATALVVTLGWQLHNARENQRWLAKRATQPYIGMYVPRIAATTLDGAARTLGQPAADYQVLYFFTTGCPYCRASAPLVKSIAGQLDSASGGRAELIGVALDPADAAGAYAREHGFAFPIVATQDRRSAMLFRARSVPLLLVVGRDGRVRYARVGAINTKDGVNGVLTAVRRTEASAAGPTTKES